ncbi:hypothetical protein HOQ57_gp07 [uncultured phage_MedDCM-OCT-S39-C11]|uniref:Uncharacterized protein n=1 Tax=uncultured phage_MedDCM-OCT-S39-C11 TaxID=2740805 RepID=A0A6S4PD57_9CAUD|nr:hypothetical protein HOQ57_gp07 [uncultured phage_MedDCM-OCT-S39-C11]BAQ94477.1 hypothetical protein [uncultured phage_MedDCM-OCT-S39-C11]
MLKALTAAAAITICCLGNEYPAKADLYSNPYPHDDVEMYLLYESLYGGERRQEQIRREVCKQTAEINLWC